MADVSDDDAPSGAAERRPFLQAAWFRVFLLIVLVAAVAGAVFWWLSSRHYEDTDDAFIDTHLIHIAPQIPGRIVAVPVRDNQLVHRGDLLAEIDPADAKARLAQAEAQVLEAQAQLQQALASQAGTAAQARNAQDDAARYRTLQKLNPAAVAGQQFDKAIAAARDTHAQVAGAAAQVAAARAKIKTLQAQIRIARLDLAHAEIRAPAEGHVTQKSVAPGNYVTAGQDLMVLVPMQLWVTANFKETQLADMRAGQPVNITVDACGGAVVRGHVDSIQRGAGQAFGILPPENATGNFVKVVQRVPVKIVLDSVPKGCVLGPGMSVEPTVKVR